MEIYGLLQDLKLNVLKLDEDIEQSFSTSEFNTTLNNDPSMNVSKLNQTTAEIN